MLIPWPDQKIIQAKISKNSKDQKKYTMIMMRKKIGPLDLSTKYFYNYLNFRV